MYFYSIDLKGRNIFIIKQTNFYFFLNINKKNYFKINFHLFNFLCWLLCMAAYGCTALMLYFPCVGEDDPSTALTYIALSLLCEDDQSTALPYVVFSLCM